MTGTPGGQDAELASLGAGLPGVLAAMPSGIALFDQRGDLVATVPPLPGPAAAGPPAAVGLLGPDGEPCVADDQPVVRVLASGQPLCEVEYGVRLPDGTIGWRLVSSHPVGPGQGLPGGVAVAFVDLTERRRDEQRQRQTEARLRFMLQLSQALAAPFELGAVLQMVVDGAAQLLELDTGAVYLRDGDVATLAATCPPLPSDFPDHLRRAPLADHVHLRTAMERAVPVAVPDTATAAFTPAEQMACQVRGLRSIVYVPLITSRRAVGALILGCTRATRAFAHEDLALCHGFAGQAAQTIENVRLFEASLRHGDALAREVAERDRAEQALATEARHVRELLAEAEESRLALVHALDVQRSAAAALRASEERFRALFEQAGDYAFVLQLTDAGPPVIVDANEAACRAHGYALAELVGQPMGLLDAGDGMADAGPSRTATILAGEVLRFETIHRRKDGITFPVEVTAKAVRREDGALLVFSTERDITERRQAEAERARLLAELAEAQRMESIGRLAGGIAHDFNNMLSAIQGYAELALQDAGSPAALREDIEQVLTACRRSADLARQLLAFARRQTIAPRPQDLNQTVDSMLAILRRLIGENIELVWQPERSLWPVCVDSSQVDQILTNLCVNARDAIADVGSITIDTRNIRIDEEAAGQMADASPGEYVVLRVTDTGCGISEESMPHVFEPFWTTKAVGAGTGLGLATVYGAARQNGGFVQVSSAVGRGTAFAVYLPRHVDAPVEQPAAPAPPAPSGTGETVLVVEDDTSIRAMVTRLLGGCGYTVLDAGSAREALALAADHLGTIDLLLTDVIMPGMNGRDLARSLAAVRPGIKCLFMSGYPADVVARHGVLTEGTHFIGKPFSMQSLVRKIQSVLAA